VDPLHATIEEFAADGYTLEANCPRCRVIRLRPIGRLPKISDWAHRCACATAAVRGMRRSAAFGQAVATDRCERRGLGTKGLTMTSETEPTASQLESRSLYHRLMRIARRFEATLKPGDDLVVKSTSAPGIRVLQISKHGEAFYFLGADAAGRSVMQIQHYSQVSLTFTVLPPAHR